MSTRSYIIVKMQNGIYKGVFCHWDGYILGVGQALINHHNSQALAEEIVSAGPIESLGGVGDGDGDDSRSRFTSRIPGYDESYNGEGSTAEECSKNISIDGAEYAYVWNGERWMTDAKPAAPPEALYELAQQVQHLASISAPE